MSLNNLDISKVTYFKLNNELNIPVDGRIPLDRDQAALAAFFKENVQPNTKIAANLQDHLHHLIETDYLEADFLEHYPFPFIQKLYDYLKAQNFRFKSFMAAYKFYNQYAMKTSDGSYYLENYELRVLFNALYFAGGDQD
ncbi:ribonucleotide-diphosphate reductase subunit alpha, partial [Lactobacillus sp. XV13L]|nr:ribonucleotide-diphosphate reductase subunit alpha [Lactobacillus sp. XV13L]